MAKKVVLDIEVNSKDALKGVDKVNDALKETGKEAGKASDEVEDIGKSAKKSGKEGEKGLSLFGKGIKGIGTAIKAAPLGLLVTIMTAVFEVMRKNQKVLDAIETATNFVAVAFKAVTTALTDAYDIITQSTEGFDAMGKVVNGLIDIALSPLKLMFYQLTVAAQTLKLGYESMFGDEEGVKKAKGSLLETRLAIQQLALDTIQSGKDVVNNFVEAVGEAGDAIGVVGGELGKIEPKELLKTAKGMTDLSNAAEIAAAKQAGLVEEYDRLAEKQRQIRDDESLSIEERKKANKELGKILEDQEIAMLKQADAQLASARAQAKVNDNLENQLALIDAETNKKGVLAAIEGKRSEQKVNAVALSKEEIELLKAQGDAESALSFAKEKFAAEQIVNEELRLEALIGINEREKEIEAERLKAIVDNANAGTQAKIDAQIALDEFLNTNAEENTTLRTNLAKKKSENEIKWEELTQQQKGQIVSKGLSDLSAILGKESAAGKAAAIASATIDTYQSAQASYKSLAGIPVIGPALGAAAAGAAIVSGIGTVKKIAATKVPGGGGGGGGSVPSAPSAPVLPQSTAPAFNVVGASGASSNQLQGVIDNQSQQPIQTYVVAGDVSTAQELDRNIVTGASI